MNKDWKISEISAAEVAEIVKAQNNVYIKIGQLEIEYGRQKWQLEGEFAKTREQLTELVKYLSASAGISTKDAMLWVFDIDTMTFKPRS